MGKSAFPEDHPLSLGMSGIWGTSAANDTTLEADVILAIGTAFAEADCSSWSPTHTFAFPPTRLIQIDTEPQEIGKIYPAEVGIVGDARDTLRALIGLLRNQPRKISGPAHAARQAQIDARKREWRQSLAVSSIRFWQANPSCPASRRNFRCRSPMDGLCNGRWLE